MMASGGPSFSSSVSNSPLSSYRSSSGLWNIRRVRVDRSCARQGLVCRTSGQAVWWPILILPVTLLTLIVSAHSQIQNETSTSRVALNSEIYMVAFATINNVKIKTGTIYNATLTGTLIDQSVESVQIARLRSGSLKRYGFPFNEITLPKGVKVVQPLRSVVLVYRRFKEYRYYNATSGNTFVAPVVGILVYTADNITNYTNIRPELTIVAPPASPIQVQLQSFQNNTPSDAICITYNNTINGTAQGAVKNLTGATSCSWDTLGDFSLLAPTRKGHNNAWKIAVGSVAGAILFVLLLAFIVLCCIRYRTKARFAKMESKSDEGETLHHTSIGGSRAPAAASTRTKPFLESEYTS